MAPPVTAKGSNFSLAEPPGMLTLPRSFPLNLNFPQAVHMQIPEVWAPGGPLSALTDLSLPHQDWLGVGMDHDRDWS